MRRKAVTLVEVLVVVVILLVLASFLFLALTIAFGGSGRANNPQNRLHDVQYVPFLGRIRTVEHDGHKFVTLAGSSSDTIIHHPDCQCLVVTLGEIE